METLGRVPSGPLRFWARLDWRDGLIASLFLALGFGIAFANLIHLEAIVQNIIFGADTNETVSAMHAITFEGDMRKHPLFSLLTAPLVAVSGTLFGLDPNRAVLTVLAIAAGLNAGLVFLALRYMDFARGLATVLGCVYCAFFSNLVLFGVPETYCVSNLALLAGLVATFGLGGNAAAWVSVALGSIAGVAALFNPPLLSLALIHALVLLRNRGVRDAFVFGGATVLSAAVVFGLVQFAIYGAEFLRFTDSYVREWASLGNLADLSSVIGVLLAFLVFSAVSPLDGLPSRLELGDITGYLGSIAGGVAAAAYLALLLLAARHALHRGDGFVFGLLGWMLAILVFYSVWNPREAMLYSSQLAFPLVFLIGRWIRSASAPPYAGEIGLAAFALLAFIHNFGVLRSPIIDGS